MYVLKLVCLNNCYLKIKQCTLKIRQFLYDKHNFNYCTKYTFIL